MSDRVPIEDPALLRKSHPLPPPPHADRPAEPGVIAGTLAWTASTLVGLPAATRQAAWEVAYMFGFNSTPIAKPHLPDTEPDLLSPHAAMGGSSASAHPPASEVSATNPVPPTLPEPETLAIANPAPPPSEEIDPGLLSNFVYDRSDRRPDGSYFVPKTLQRLFHVRTMPAKSAELPVIVKIAGRIIPDPQAHGTVQASVTGRIEPPDEGLPVLGGAVTKGQILGWVAPAVGVVDRTQVRREVARLTTDIRVEVEQLEILKQFRFVPFRDGKIYQAEQRIAGLRREREALLPLLQTREALRASSDGIISVSNAIVGQIVQAGDIVFQVIDPKRL
ncbi:MAG: HlyD family efflux transporter periplasmic adaptor subunit, partial [Acetobacteraceae bacterium]